MLSTGLYGLTMVDVLFGIQVWCRTSLNWFSWLMEMCLPWGLGRAGAWTSSMARIQTSAMVRGLRGNGEISVYIWLIVYRWHLTDLLVSW